MAPDTNCFMCNLVAAFVVGLMHTAQCVPAQLATQRDERIHNSNVLPITFWSRGKEELQWFSGSAADHHIATCFWISIFLFTVPVQI